MQANYAVSRRWRRSLFTLAAVGVGVGSLVATAGISTTASAQIAGRFDRLKATEVTLRQDQATDGARSTRSFGPEVDDRLAGLNGVVSGGPVCDWQPADLRVETPWDPDPAVALSSVSAGALTAAGVQITNGRNLTETDIELSLPVAIVSRGAMQPLGEVAPGSILFVGGEAVTVVGTYNAVDRREALLTAVVIPITVANRIKGQDCPSGTEVLISTTPGAAEVVASDAPLALLPTAPDTLQAQVPPDPRALRAGVSQDIAALYGVLAAVAVAMAALVVANSASVGVVERTREIGLLRALGSSQREVALIFMWETTITGLLGAAIGSIVGIFLVQWVSIVMRWSIVFDLRLPLLGLALGGVAGLVGGAVPARRASRIEPADALRR